LTTAGFTGRSAMPPWKKTWPTVVKQKLMKDFNLNADQIAKLEAYGSLADLQAGEKQWQVEFALTIARANELFAEIKKELQNFGVV
jgi:hypothetical protein